MTTADEIAKLAALRDSGDLTPEQFETEKAKLLAAPRPFSPPVPTTATAAPMPGKKNASQKRGCVTLFIVVVVVAIIIGIVSSSSGPGSNVKGKVQNVVAL